jgi:glycosyltransferase involved in cell wall biosynthesis
MKHTASISDLNGTRSSTSETVAVTILMPCLDEEETLGRCIQKAQSSLQRLNVQGEILIADNGSTDRSVEIAERLGARVVRVQDKGYGNALRAGIEGARGTWIVMGDADDSYDFSALDRFVEKLQQGYQLVMGCRMPAGGGRIMAGAMPWKHRWLGNPVLSWVGRLFFKCPVHDFHCGLRGFSKEAYEQMNLRTTGMEFASEMVIKATLKSLRIAEVPITLFKDGRSRPPHLRSWRDGWRHLRFMLLFSPTWLFLVPGAALMLLGSGFGIRLISGPLKIGVFGFDTNTLLVCSMSAILGLQVCVFGLLTRMFASTEGLLPPSRRLTALASTITLEKGVFVGMALFAAGLLLLLNASFTWSAVRFGSLSYPESLRLVIPAVTLMTVGGQVIFASFFLGVLGLPRK